jgi:hypothetical protein
MANSLKNIKKKLIMFVLALYKKKKHDCVFLAFFQKRKIIF